MNRCFVDEAAEANARILTFLAARNERSRPLVAPPEEFDNPYLTLGSHPDVVERVWVDLCALLDPGARCVVLGGPALADPVSGIVVAIALGTAYALRVAPADAAAAREAGLCSTHDYNAPPSRLDVGTAFGPDWVIGAFRGDEPQWVANAAAAMRGA